jgi:hypothetical protein
MNRYQPHLYLMRRQWCNYLTQDPQIRSLSPSSTIVLTTSDNHLLGQFKNEFKKVVPCLKIIKKLGKDSRPLLMPSPRISMSISLALLTSNGSPRSPLLHSLPRRHRKELSILSDNTFKI